MNERLSKAEIESIKALRAQGHKLAYIIYKTKRDAKTIMIYSPSGAKCIPWSEEELQKAKSFRKSGFSYKEIGIQIGHSDVAVSQMFYKLKRSGLYDQKRIYGQSRRNLLQG